MGNRSFASQKAALTRAIKTNSPEILKAECKRTVEEWDSRREPFSYGWPDDWARWQRALDDCLPWHSSIRLEEL